MPKAYGNGRARSVANGKDVSASIQADLFQQLERSALECKNAPPLDLGVELVGVVNRALREARAQGLSRDRVVDRMNACLAHDGGEPITKRQIDAWTAASKEFHRFPAEYLPAFCWATGSDEPLRFLAGALGFGLVDSREDVAKRLGETHVRIAQLRREQHDLAKTLGSAT